MTILVYNTNMVTGTPAAHTTKLMQQLMQDMKTQKPNRPATTAALGLQHNSCS
jgi:hypothetical protein